jgi:hypothetical protein
MSDTGADALQGTREYIEGPYVFEVQNKGVVIGDGMMIQHWAPGSRDAKHQHNTTGEEGWPVEAGEKVKVYRAYVRFTWL